MQTIPNSKKAPSNDLRIHYCPACGWMLRASWLAQEILSTFNNEVSSVSLVPAREEAGFFEIWVNQNRVWCRKQDQGFPQPKELKQRIRDLICPDRRLGHSDKKA